MRAKIRQCEAVCVRIVQKCAHIEKKGRERVIRSGVVLPGVLAVPTWTTTTVVCVCGCVYFIEIFICLYVLYVCVYFHRLHIIQVILINI